MSKSIHFTIEYYTWKSRLAMESHPLGSCRVEWISTEVAGFFGCFHVSIIYIFIGFYVFVYWMLQDFICIYVSMYLDIQVSRYLGIYVSMYLCIYVSIYLCIYVSMYPYLPTYLPTVCTYLHRVVHTWMIRCTARSQQHQYVLPWEGWRQHHDRGARQLGPTNMVILRDIMTGS